MKPNYFIPVMEEVIKDKNSYIKFAAWAIKQRTGNKVISLTGEDIFQEAFCKCMENKRGWNPQYRTKPQFIKTMVSIIRNEFVNFYTSDFLAYRNDKLKKGKDPVSEFDNSIDNNRIISRLFDFAREKGNEDLLLVLEKTYQGFKPLQIAKETYMCYDRIKYLKKIIKQKLLELQPPLTS